MTVYYMTDPLYDSRPKSKVTAFKPVSTELWFQTYRICVIKGNTFGLSCLPKGSVGNFCRESIDEVHHRDFVCSSAT